jgi:hypothetical protein
MIQDMFASKNSKNNRTEKEYRKPHRCEYINENFLPNNRGCSKK